MTDGVARYKIKTEGDTSGWDKIVEVLDRLKTGTDDYRRSLQGLTTVNERSTRIQETMKEEGKSLQEVEKAVARDEKQIARTRLEENNRRLVTARRMTSAVTERGGLQRAAGRGVAGLAGRAAALGGGGGGGAAAGVAGVVLAAGAVMIKGTMDAIRLVEQYDEVERRIKTVDTRFGELRESVQDVGLQFGYTRGEMATAFNELTKFSGQIENVRSMGEAMATLTAAARGFGLRPEALAAEIGQFQRLTGEDMTDPGKQRDFVMRLAEAIGQTGMGGRTSEFIKATEQLTGTAAEILGMADPGSVIALQRAIGVTKDEGMLGERGAQLLSRIHTAISQPAGEQQFGFRFRALGQGLGVFQTMARIEQGVFGAGNLSDMLRQGIIEAGGRVPTGARLEELRQGGFQIGGAAGLTETEARTASIIGKQLGLTIPRTLALLQAMAPGGEVRDIDFAGLEQQLAEIGQDISILSKITPDQFASVTEELRSTGRLTEDSLNRLREVSPTEVMKQASSHLDAINTQLGTKFLPLIEDSTRAVVSIAEFFGFGRGEPAAEARQAERRGAAAARRARAQEQADLLLTAEERAMGGVSVLGPVPGMPRQLRDLLLGRDVSSVQQGPGGIPSMPVVSGNLTVKAVVPLDGRVIAEVNEERSMIEAFTGTTETEVGS